MGMAGANEQTFIFTFTINKWLSYTRIFNPQSLRKSFAFRFGCSNNLKLFRIILTQKCDRHTHHTGVIHWNILDFTDLDGIVVVILRPTFKRQLWYGTIVLIIGGRQEQFFMTLFYIQIRKPRRIANGLISNTIFDLLTCFDWKIIRYHEPHLTSALSCNAQPHSIRLNQRKNLFVCNSIHIPNNQELLIVFHQLCNILTEQ